MAELGGFGLDALHDVRGFELRVVLDAFDQIALRFFSGETGDLFDAMTLLFDERVELGFALDHFLLAIRERAVALLDFRHARVELLRLFVEGFFLLLKAPFGGLQLLATFLSFAIEIRSHLEQFFFRFEVSFLDLRLGGFPRVFDDAVGVAAGLGDMRLTPFRKDGPP